MADQFKFDADRTFAELVMLMVLIAILQASCDGRPGLTVKLNDQEYHVEFGEEQ